MNKPIKVKETKTQKGKYWYKKNFFLKTGVNLSALRWKLQKVKSGNSLIQ